MRLSEKTIELNFCSQVGRVLRPTFWFGLTQRQEARMGFDAAARIGGRTVVLQFKASANVLQSGVRRFWLPHQQLERLRGLTHPPRMRSVFYVLPNVGTSSEARGAAWNLLSNTWLLDAADLSAVKAPLTRDGTPRKREIHYADLEPPWVTIHSETVRVEAIPALSFFVDRMPGSEGFDVVSQLKIPLRQWRPLRGAASALVISE
jgi:hypothetical protein